MLEYYPLDIYLVKGFWEKFGEWLCDSERRQREHLDRYFVLSEYF